MSSTVKFLIVLLAVAQAKISSQEYHFSEKLHREKSCMEQQSFVQECHDKVRVPAETFAGGLPNDVTLTAISGPSYGSSAFGGTTTIVGLLCTGKPPVSAP